MRTLSQLRLVDITLVLSLLVPPTQAAAGEPWSPVAPLAAATRQLPQPPGRVDSKRLSPQWQAPHTPSEQTRVPLDVANLSPAAFGDWDGPAAR